MQYFIKIDRLPFGRCGLTMYGIPGFNIEDRENARVNQENVVIDTIISMTKKVIFRNKMNSKTSHSNVLKYQTFLQMGLEE